MEGPLLEELQELIAGLCERDLTPAQKSRLDELVRTNEECCEYYVKAMHVEAALPRFAGAAVRSAAAIVAEWQSRQGSNQDVVLRAWAQCDLEDLDDALAADPHSDLVFPAPGATSASAILRNASDREGNASDRQPILVSLANILHRGVVSMPRAAAVLLFMGALSVGALGASAVTLSVIRTSVEASPIGIQNVLLGSRCIGRTERDLASGTVCFVRHPTTVSGRAGSFSFYNVHADNDRWITPIILALDPITSTYRITGIGQPVLNLGSGLQTVPFQLVAGSGDLQAGVHTFGFYHGTVDKTGKATRASQGPLDFDPLPKPDGSGEDHDAEARWLFVPWDATPVQLRLDLEFSLAAGSIQVTISPGTETPRERIYSGRLEITVEPEIRTNKPFAANNFHSQ